MRIDSDAVETRSKLPGSARRVPRQDHRHRAGCIRLKREPSTRRPLLFLIMFIINARRVYGNRCPPIRDLSARPSRRNIRVKKKKKKKKRNSRTCSSVSPPVPLSGRVCWEFSEPCYFALKIDVWFRCSKKNSLSEKCCWYAWKK